MFKPDESGDPFWTLARSQYVRRLLFLILFPLASAGGAGAPEGWYHFGVEGGPGGTVTCNDTGFITEREPDSVRGPDISYWTKERLKDVIRMGAITIEEKKLT